MFNVLSRIWPYRTLPPAEAVCAEPWQKLAITIEGLIACCFRSPNGPAGDTRSVTDWRLIWNGREFREFRAAVRREIPTRSPCKICPHTQSSNVTKFLCDDEGARSDTPYGRNMRLAREEFEKGATNLGCLPSILHVEPSALCNLDCIMCAQHNSKSAVNSEEFVQKVIDDLAPYLTLLNWSGGEPLAQPSFDHFRRTFDPATNPFLSISLMTNGQLLRESHMEFFKRSTVRRRSTSRFAETENGPGLSR